MIDYLKKLTENLISAGVTISSEVPASNPSSQLIDCRGLSAQDALRDLRGVKGEMLVLHSKDITLSRPVRMLHPRHPLYLSLIHI